MNDDLALLTETAREAGQLALLLREEGLQIDNKPGGSPVTNADLAVDELLKGRLREARPEFGWLSEETPDDHARLAHDTIFMADPIDGTSAFMKGRDWWSVCIAIVREGRPVTAVVYAPSVGEMYAAIEGQGATLNGEPITASRRNDLEGSSMLAFEKMFDHPSWPTPWPAMSIEQRNSIAYRMCLVASGAFDATFSPKPKHDWDLAAGDLIVHEAGGVASDHLGRPFVYNLDTPLQRSLMCAGAGLHPLLLERVAHIEE